MGSLSQLVTREEKRNGSYDEDSVDGLDGESHDGMLRVLAMELGTEDLLCRGHARASSHESRLLSRLHYGQALPRQDGEGQPLGRADWAQEGGQAVQGARRGLTSSIAPSLFSRLTRGGRGGAKRPHRLLSFWGFAALNPSPTPKTKA